MEDDRRVNERIFTREAMNMEVIRATHSHHSQVLALKIKSNMPLRHSLFTHIDTNRVCGSESLHYISNKANI